MLSTRTLATTALVVATQVLQVELSVADKNYEPTGTVQWLHDRPRRTINGDDAPNTFPEGMSAGGSLDPDKVRPYAEGVGTLAAVFIVVGALTFLLLGFAYLLACCRCCGQPSIKYWLTITGGAPGMADVDPASNMNTEMAQAHEAAKLTRARVCRKSVFVILAGVVVYAAMAFSAMGMVATGKAGAHSMVQSLHGLAGIFGSANGVMQDADTLMLGMQNNLTSVRDIVVEWNTLYTASSSETQELEDALDKAVSLSKDNRNLLLNGKDSGKFLESAASDAADQADASIESNMASVGYGYAGGLLAITLLLFLSLAPFRMCTMCYKGAVTLNLIWLLVIWLLTAVLLAVAVLFSDFCVAPGDTLTTAATPPAGLQPNSTALDQVLANSVSYYTVQCNPALAPTDPGPEAVGLVKLQQDIVHDAEGVFSQAKNLSSVLRQVLEDFESAPPGFKPPQSQRDSVNASAAYFESASVEARDILRGSLSILNCARVQNDVWVPFRDGLCTDVVGGALVPLWATQTVCAVATIVILAFGVPLCHAARHPAGRAVRRQMLLDCGFSPEVAAAAARGGELKLYDRIPGAAGHDDDAQASQAEGGHVEMGRKQHPTGKVAPMMQTPHSDGTAASSKAHSASFHAQQPAGSPEPPAHQQDSSAAPVPPGYGSMAEQDAQRSASPSGSGMLSNGSHRSGVSMGSGKSADAESKEEEDE